MLLARAWGEGQAAMQPQELQQVPRAAPPEKRSSLAMAWVSPEVKAAATRALGAAATPVEAVPLAAGGWLEALVGEAAVAQAAGVALGLQAVMLERLAAAAAQQLVARATEGTRATVAVTSKAVVTT